MAITQQQFKCREIIARHDPYGLIIHGAPWDEYNSEADHIYNTLETLFECGNLSFSKIEYHVYSEFGYDGYIAGFLSSKREVAIIIELALLYEVMTLE